MIKIFEQKTVSSDQSITILSHYEHTLLKLEFMITEAKFLLRSAKGDCLACGFAGGHLDVNAGLGEDLVDAVALRSDDVTMLRLLHLDRNRGHLFLL